VIFFCGFFIYIYFDLFIMTEKETETSKMTEEEIRKEVESIMKYDETTSKEELKARRKKLSALKHNVMNRTDIRNLDGLLLLIVTAQVQLENSCGIGKDGLAQEIDPSKVYYDQLRDYIGCGVYGRVYRASIAGSTVAIKVPKDPARLTSEQIAMFKHEANIMARLRHENIVNFLGACFDPSNLMIVTALMKTDLYKLIHDTPNPLSLQLKLKIAYESALGLYWIHDVCDMIHRDLKPENILVDDKSVAHIGDFGFTQTLHGKQLRDSGVPVGTVLYMAPEVYLCQPFDDRSDVHSFGLILFELFTGIRPFPEVKNCSDFYETVILGGVRPQIRNYPNVPKGIMDIAERCWRPDMTERPRMNEVVDAIFNTIVDLIIPPDSTNPANNFWKTHFPGCLTLPWSKFQSVINTTVTVDPSVFPILEKFMCGKDDIMTMELFQHYFLYFGRWFESPGEPLIKEMIDLFQAPWYFHEMDSSNAQMLLTGRPGGTFIIRLSIKDRRTPFALSFMKKGTGNICHCYIHRLSYDPNAAERYSLPGFGTFRSVGSLVNDLITKNICSEPCGRQPIKEIVYFQRQRQNQ